MSSIKAAAPPKSRHRRVVVGLLAIVLVGGIVSFILRQGNEEPDQQMEEFQIVDITAPPPPPPPPPEEESMEEPEDSEEAIEPLEMSAGPDSPSEESSEVDLGIDIGDLAASAGAGGFVMDIPRFGRRGGGGGDDDGGLLGGDTDAPPTPVNKAQPTYPSALLKKGIGGRVIISCIIDDTGRVTSTTIKQSSGHEDLDKAAINAVTKWKFKPGTKAGRAVKATCLVPFNFEVKKG